MPTIVYKYSLLKPMTNADLVDEQIIEGHKYRNALTEIERESRDKLRSVLSKGSETEREAFFAARDALEAAENAIKDQRASTRSMSETTEQTDILEPLRKHKKKTLAALRKKSKEIAAKQETKDAVKAIHNETNQKEKDARKYASQERNLFWGTYLHIENAHSDSKAELKLWDKRGEPNDPKFLPFRGEGVVSVQIHKTQQLAVEKNMEGEGRWVQIKMLPLPANPSKRQTKRRHAILRIRVGSNPDRTPIWAEWKMLLHRPLPRDAVITWAKVFKTMTADHERWNVDLTLNIPLWAKKGDPCGSGNVAIDIGWRKLSTGDIRIAYSIDDAGKETEYRLSREIVSILKHVDSLQSIRDKNMNRLYEDLRSWKNKLDDLPAWFKEKTRNMHKWKSSRRYAGLLYAWKQNRFDGDRDGFNILNDWQYGTYEESLGRRDGGDRHLWQWQEHERRHALNKRKYEYRMIAANIARRYSNVIIENFDLSEMQEDPDVEVKKRNKAAKWQQRAAACYILRDSIIKAFTSRNGTVEDVNPSMTTRRCFVCGNNDEWDAAHSIMHTCEKCGSEWDQDANAAKNLMKKYKDGDIGRERSKKKKKGARKSRKRARRKGPLKNEHPMKSSD